MMGIKSLNFMLITKIFLKFLPNKFSFFQSLFQVNFFTKVNLHNQYKISLFIIRKGVYKIFYVLSVCLFSKFKFMVLKIKKTFNFYYSICQPGPHTWLKMHLSANRCRQEPNKKGPLFQAFSTIYISGRSVLQYNPSRNIHHI